MKKTPSFQAIFGRCLTTKKHLNLHAKKDKNIKKTEIKKYQCQNPKSKSCVKTNKQNNNFLN